MPHDGGMTRLTPDILLQAYRLGVFPMAESRDATEIGWYDPPMRGVLPIHRLHVPARLARTVRQGVYRVTFDRAFADVIRACADARPETWINDDIIRLYTETHRLGAAHSVEAWDQDGHLAGGLYGIAQGGAFFGESMFSRKTDASKVAFVHLVARLWRRGFTLLDAQFVNAHLRQFGVMEIPRHEYHRRLRAALALDVSFGGGAVTAADYSSLSPSSGAGPGSARGAAGAVSAASSPGSLSGEDSDENSVSLVDVRAFLQSITQTS